MPNINDGTPVYRVKTAIETLPKEVGALVLKLYEHQETALRIQMAPAHASASWNYAFQGGLLESIADRCDWVDKFANFAETAPPTEGPMTLTQQLKLCVLLQDLFCIGDVFGNHHFIPNILKSGKASTAEPFKSNPECHIYFEPSLSHLTKLKATAYLLSAFHTTCENGDLSLALVAAYGGELINYLSADIILAIRCRQGLYGKNHFLMRGKETPLIIALNFLNMWSAQMARLNVTEQKELVIPTSTKMKI